MPAASWPCCRACRRSRRPRLSLPGGDAGAPADRGSAGTARSGVVPWAAVVLVPLAGQDGHHGRVHPGAVPAQCLAQHALHEHHPVAGQGGLDREIRRGLINHRGDCASAQARQATRFTGAAGYLWSPGWRLFSLIRRLRAVRGSSSATAAAGSVGRGRSGSRTPAVGGRLRQCLSRSATRRHAAVAMLRQTAMSRRTTCPRPRVISRIMRGRDGPVNHISARSA
jgi:hypothetical protein